MPQRFLPRINVDDFCTVNRRTLLRGLGSAALLTTAGGLYRGGRLGQPRLRRCALHTRGRLR